MKTFASAVTYRFVLRRRITDVQLGGSLLMVLSVAVAKVPDVVSANQSERLVNALPMSAILLAAFACIVSGERFPRGPPDMMSASVGKGGQGRSKGRCVKFISSKCGQGEARPKMWTSFMEAPSICAPPRT